MSKPRSQDNPWKAVGLVSAIGVELVVCMLGGYFGGTTLSRWQGGQPIWIVVGIMAGFAVGVAGVFLLLRHFTEGSD
ncbi:AtpZ/AtpI family protein [Paenibacillus sp. HJGM_3]|uniref:AtpZ/AtpI family protein n=1 Tax=Paenibacillus sp. HJGM_3 TaxID=3379816 RepID=UPI00385E51C3